MITCRYCEEENKDDAPRCKACFNDLHVIGDFDYIHHWFGLSYANYLVIPRTVLQSMPPIWQNNFTSYLREMLDRIEYEDGPYRVRKITKNGKYDHDDLADYQRGRRKLKLKPKSK